MKQDKRIKLLSEHFIYNIGVKDIRGMQINSCSKNRLIIQDWQSYIVIPASDLTAIGLTTVKMRDFLLDNGAEKRKRQKREIPYVLYD